MSVASDKISDLKEVVSHLSDRVDAAHDKHDSFRLDIEKRMVVLEMKVDHREAMMSHLKRVYLTAIVGLLFGLMQAFIITWMIDVPSPYSSSKEVVYHTRENSHEDSGIESESRHIIT